MSGKKWLHDNFFVGLYLMLTKGRQDLIVLKEGAEIVEGGLADKVLSANESMNLSSDIPMKVGYGRWLILDDCEQKKLMLTKRDAVHLKVYREWKSLFFATYLLAAPILLVYHYFPSPILWLIEVAQLPTELIRNHILPFYVGRIHAELITHGYSDRAELFTFLSLVGIANFVCALICFYDQFPKIRKVFIVNMKDRLINVQDSSVKKVHAIGGSFRYFSNCLIALALFSFCFTLSISSSTDYSVTSISSITFFGPKYYHISDFKMFMLVAGTHAFFAYSLYVSLFIKICVSTFLREYVTVVNLVQGGYLKWAP